MNRLNAIWSIISHYKYLIVIVIGVLIVGFVDQNSFRKRIEYELQISDLQAEIDKYNAKNAADTKELRELRNDPNAIEKIARERYFMKADDEDIYVLSDDPQPGAEESQQAAGETE